MHVWLVTPAHARFNVTALALAQRAHLRGELADKGIELHSVLIADDDNLDIAHEYGFDTVERDNSMLGAKVNDGIEYAMAHGADYVAFVGSDNWTHPDVFDALHDEPGRIVTGHQFAAVDVARNKLRVMDVPGADGVAPWFIPRAMLETAPARPVREDKSRGLDLALKVGARLFGDWTHTDPHPMARVDFKTDMNITPYEQVSRFPGVGPEQEAWAALDAYYPPALVDMAYRLGELVAA